MSTPPFQATSVVLVVFTLVWPQPGYPNEPVATHTDSSIIAHITITGNSRTRSEIIRRELLFRPGDRLDSSIVQETERNLRRLFFLGSARISASPSRLGDAGTAEVNVEVEDLYSRALSPLFSGQPDELSYGVVALDYNLLGRGQIAQLSLHHDAISGNSGSVHYQIPRLRGTRHRVSANIGIGEEGHDHSLSLNHPLHALSSRWSYGISARSSERISRLYSGSDLAARYTSRVEAGALRLTHSRGDDVKLRPSLRLSVTDRRFLPTREFDYAPQDRRRVVAQMSLLVWRPRYERTHFIRALGRVEDLQIGSWAGASLGLSHRAFGSDRNFPVGAVHISPRFKAGSATYAFTTFSTSSRFGGGGYYNLTTTSQILAYTVVEQMHTLALRLRFDTLSRPEDASQFLLGVDRGLRGYRPRSLNGSRRLLFNVEARPTFLTERQYVVAGAVFMDAGTAWEPGGSSPRLEASAGLGGRLGLPTIYSTPVFRVDLARGIGRLGVWQLSFAIGQYF